MQDNNRLFKAAQKLALYYYSRGRSMRKEGPCTRSEEMIFPMTTARKGLRSSSLVLGEAKQGG